jgi:hypothetical protein
MVDHDVLTKTTLVSTGFFPIQASMPNVAECGGPVHFFLAPPGRMGAVGNDEMMK